MEWNYANKNHSTIINEKNGVVYLTFPKLAAAGVRHGFSTRMGGVSKGYLGTMNLSFTRGDREENVRENFAGLRTPSDSGRNSLCFPRRFMRQRFGK